MTSARMKGRDWLFAALLSLLVLALALMHLTTGLPDWGDDHAAYIAEGIAIADGGLHGQARLNRFMHPTPLPDEAAGEELVYAWGFPLLLSAVYRAAGFDADGGNILLYKLPSALCLALLAGALYLFFRGRFGVAASAGLSVLFFAWGEWFDALNIIYSDIVFLFFSTLALLLMERFAASDARPARRVLLALGYGAALWFTREVRLNGTAVCAAAALGHGIYVFRHRGEKRGGLWLRLLPYAVMLALTLLSERLWLAPATGNASDLAGASWSAALSHAKDAARTVFAFLDSMGGARTRAVGLALGVCAIVGLLTGGFGDNFHLTALLAGTVAVVCLLPYSQGARYLYNIMPLVLLYAALGARWLLRRATALFSNRSRAMRLAARAAAAALVCASLAGMGVGAVRALARRDDRGPMDVFSAGAVDIYHYVRENLPGDAVIAFNKPRALYLTTGRACFRENVNGHGMDGADWFLHYKASVNSRDVYERNRDMLTPAYENELFALYGVK